jgi:hypothetical protein
MRATASASSEVGAGDLHLGPGHGGQHGQAAVAGAQVQHGVGLLAEPGSMLPSASSSAMKLRGTMTRSST